MDSSYGIKSHCEILYHKQIFEFKKGIPLEDLNQKCDLSTFKRILDLTSKYTGADWTEQKQILSNSSKS